MNTKNSNQPIPYAVTDLPIPYRVRVATPSPELRAFVVPYSQPVTFNEEPKSETRLKVA
jgi:hypothetical protein